MQQATFSGNGRTNLLLQLTPVPGVPGGLDRLPREVRQVDYDYVVLGAGTAGCMIRNAAASAAFSKALPDGHAADLVRASNEGSRS